jgi:cephalosporin hydroxylase
LVSPNSYIVVTDSIMQDLADVPRGQPGWTHDNPSRAALDFLQLHPEFVIEQPAWPFNESQLTQNVTHWPNAWLRRLPAQTP